MKSVTPRVTCTGSRVLSGSSFQTIAESCRLLFPPLRPPSATLASIRPARARTALPSAPTAAWPALSSLPACCLSGGGSTRRRSTRPSFRGRAICSRRRNAPSRRRARAVLYAVLCVQRRALAVRQIRLEPQCAVGNFDNVLGFRDRNGYVRGHPGKKPQVEIVECDHRVVGHHVLNRRGVHAHLRHGSVKRFPRK